MGVLENIFSCNMSKRIYAKDSEIQNVSNKKKAERMCRNKLKNISVKCQLYPTVLVLNTLKYVQNSKHIKFDEDDENEPAEKKMCNQIRRRNIYDILDEMTSLQ